MMSARRGAGERGQSSGLTATEQSSRAALQAVLRALRTLAVRQQKVFR